MRRIAAVFIVAAAYPIAVAAVDVAEPFKVMRVGFVSAAARKALSRMLLVTTLLMRRIRVPIQHHLQLLMQSLVCLLPTHPSKNYLPL
jgi:hypothetical protein